MFFNNLARGAKDSKSGSAVFLQFVYRVLSLMCFSRKGRATARMCLETRQYESISDGEKDRSLRILTIRISGRATNEAMATRARRGV